MEPRITPSWARTQQKKKDFLKTGKPLQTFWKERNVGSTWSFFCPLCRATRKLPCRPRPSARHYAQVALTTFVFMLATWNWFEWKGIVAFVPLWIGFEVFLRTRVRTAVSCPHCGFDPYLYLVDVQRARQEIENHWRKKFSEKGIPFPEKDKPGSLSKPSAVSAPAEPAVSDEKST